MPNNRNISQFQQISQAVNDSTAIYLIDYRGIEANSFNLLRRSIAKDGAQLQVVKNTLLKRALQSSKQPIKLDESVLTDSTAALFTGEDLISPLKTIIKFSKDNDKGNLKTGFYQGEILSLTKLQQLSNLPSREILIAQLLGMLINPIQRLAGALNGNTQKLVIALSEIQKQKTN